MHSFQSLPDSSSLPDFHAFHPTTDPSSIKWDLVMLKLKGYMDRRNITGHNLEMQKVPERVQVGRMVEGEPWMEGKGRKGGKGGKEMGLVEYYLEMDRKEMFSKRKFN
jgi:hypothetical protein